MPEVGPGGRIGRYRIESLLGQGGMGEVYRAYDEMLRRRVALKVLRRRPEGDGENASTGNVNRVLREARMAAALDHPNVVAIFDVGEADDVAFIVMEHVNGTPLRSFVGHPEVSLADRMRWLVEIARALAAAHRAGLVHRDIKPENVMIREDGVVKVLDFGIARRSRPDSMPPPPPGLRDSTHPMRPGETIGAGTQEGRVVGTPAYMAPEQIRTGQSDARADQFAWGVLGYELLTGQLPWPTPSKHGSLLLDVLNFQPEPLHPDALGVSSEVTDAIERSMRKDPTERFASMEGLLASIGAGISDSGRKSLPDMMTPPSVRVDAETLDAGHVRIIPLQAPISHRTLSPAAQSPNPPPRVREVSKTPKWAIAAMIAASIVVAGRILLSKKSDKPQTETSSGASASAPASNAAPSPTFAFHPREVTRLTFALGCEEYPSFTPDGREVVFDGASGHDWHLYALDLATGAQRALTNDPGWQWAPAVSPDGKQIAFVKEQDGRQAAYLMPFDGSSPARFLANGVVRPSWSPDGKALWIGTIDSAIRIDPANGATMRTIKAPPSYEMVAVHELPDGRVIGRFGDRQMHLVKGIAVYPPGVDENPKWLTQEILDETGLVPPGADVVLTTRLNRGEHNELIALPLNGAPEIPLLDKSVQATKGLVLSPKGDRIVWSTCSARYDVVVAEKGADGRVSPRAVVPMTEWMNGAPAWVPGTRHVVMASDRANGMALWVTDLDDRDVPRKLPTGELRVGAPRVSADGKWVVFAALGEGIHVMPLDGSKPPTRLSHGADDACPSFSRDGKTIYFEGRDKDGKPQIDAVAPGGGPIKNIRANAACPVASPIDDRLAFIDVNGNDSFGRPSFFSLSDRRTTPISSELPEAHYPQLRFSGDGKKIAALRSETEVREVEAQTGKSSLRYESGTEQLGSIEYVGEQLHIARLVWTGDLWSAKQPF